MTNVNYEKLENVLDRREYFSYLIDDYIKDEDYKDNLVRILNKCILETMEAYGVDENEVERIRLRLY